MPYPNRPRMEKVVAEKRFGGPDFQVPTKQATAREGANLGEGSSLSLVHQRLDAAAWQLAQSVNVVTSRF